MSLQGSPNPRPTTSPPAPQAGDVALSPQEREILSHVVEAHSNAVIAQHLGMTEADAKINLTNLLRKIGVENRTQAVIWALRQIPEFSETLRGSV
jgi:two-component system nitrate/nitrite response regulator NarL